jgi:hypothetical protein
MNYNIICSQKLHSNPQTFRTGQHAPSGHSEYEIITGEYMDFQLSRLSLSQNELKATSILHL